MQFAVLTVTWFILCTICNVGGQDFPTGRGDTCVSKCKTDKLSFVVRSYPNRNLCLKTKGDANSNFKTTVKRKKKDYDYCQMCVTVKNAQKIKITYTHMDGKTGVEEITAPDKFKCWKKENLKSATFTYIPVSSKRVQLANFLFGCCNRNIRLGSVLVSPPVQPMAYITNCQYDWVYDDRRTGAYVDFSIWRPKAVAGFYALGDVAKTQHSMPTDTTVMVKALTATALAFPTGASEIWNDRGSGGTYDVRVFQLIGPPGYSCLGDVAVLGYNSVPDLSLYRCVKDTYLFNGAFQAIWKDSGSGASDDFSAWKILSGSPSVLVPNGFRSHKTHATLGCCPKVLSTSFLTQENYLVCARPNPSLAYITNVQYDWVYDDRRTRADVDFSIWRPKAVAGFYALGDVAKTQHSMPTTPAVMVKALTADALAVPTGASEIWNDRGSGGIYDVRVMQLSAPQGYSCLGDVAVLGYSNVPDLSQYRCVKNTYLIGATFKAIWKDSGSGANADFSAWQIMSGTPSALVHNSFRSHNSHSTLDCCYKALSTKFLKKEGHSVSVGKRDLLPTAGQSPGV